MQVLLCMGICMSVQVPMRRGQRHQICWSWSNRQLWAPWYGHWEPNSCSLWEQCTILTTEPSFQLPVFGLWVSSQAPCFLGIVFWMAPLEGGKSSKKSSPVDSLWGEYLRGGVMGSQAPLHWFASWPHSVWFYSSTHLSCDLLCNYRSSLKATRQLIRDWSLESTETLSLWVSILDVLL